MSTGYSWEGLRQVGYVRRHLVHAKYLSTSVVAVCIWGTITNVHLYLYLYAAPLLGETKTNVMRTYQSSYLYNGYYHRCLLHCA